jgi:hypothetical protein
MMVSILPYGSVRDISREVLENNGKARLLSSTDWKKYEWESFRAFCHFHARYGITTIELIDFLKERINGRNAIEIGAGTGDLGYHMRLPMTDSRIQENIKIRQIYHFAGQPVIKYPDDVMKFDAISAIRKFRPEVVIGSWVTRKSETDDDPNSFAFGVDEIKLLSMVDTYILIGNTDVHQQKPIMNIQHDEYYFDWIVSRAKNQTKNRIWIWNRK